MDEKANDLESQYDVSVTNSASTTFKPKYCTRCGGKLEENEKFCSQCGEPIAASTPQISYQAPSVEQNTPQPVSSPPIETITPQVPYQAPSVERNTPPSVSASSPKKSKWKSIGSTLSTIVTIIFLIFAFTKHPVMDTKGIVFSAYGTKDLGTAVNETIPNANWSSEKNSKNNYYVTVSGYCTSIQQNLSITFDVTYSGDHVHAQPKFGEIDDEVFADVFSLNFALELIYNAYD